MEIVKSSICSTKTMTLNPKSEMQSPKKEEEKQWCNFLVGTHQHKDKALSNCLYSLSFSTPV